MLHSARKETIKCISTHHIVIKNRQKGEIVNPITGEIVTNCLTLGIFAKALDITTDHLTKLMQELGMVDLVLDYRLIPMIQAPALRKPSYFHTPAATQNAIADNLIISLKIRRGEMMADLLLITPRGQAILSAQHEAVLPKASAVSQRRDKVSQLFQKGFSALEIMERTDLPRRTVFRYLKDIKAKTHRVPLFG